jgi:hypothetical protein
MLVASRLRRIKRQFELTNGCGVNMNLRLRAHRTGVSGGSSFCGCLSYNAAQMPVGGMPEERLL